MGRVGDRLGIAGELLSFFWTRKCWWLAPIVLALFVFGGLLLFTESSAIAPFIYTLF